MVAVAGRAAAVAGAVLQAHCGRRGRESVRLVRRILLGDVEGVTAVLACYTAA
ncbi:hypothetical protein [Nonomuraea sp. NPDC048901]|uniref:hypothetical protein n=1 Tax=Nonomuraea sp. NPDC048901 TaxID=3155627 RepID=UPI0033CC57A5